MTHPLHSQRVQLLPFFLFSSAGLTQFIFFLPYLLTMAQPVIKAFGSLVTLVCKMGGEYTGFVIINDDGSLVRADRPLKNERMAVFFHKGRLVDYVLNRQGPPSSWQLRQQRGYCRYDVVDRETGEVYGHFDDHIFDPNPIDPKAIGAEAACPKSLDDSSDETFSDDPGSQVAIPLPTALSDDDSADSTHKDGADSPPPLGRLRSRRVVAVPTSLLDEEDEDIDKFLKFPYGRDTGSDDDDWDPEENHYGESLSDEDCDSEEWPKTRKSRRSRPYPKVAGKRTRSKAAGKRT